MSDTSEKDVSRRRFLQTSLLGITHWTYIGKHRYFDNLPGQQSYKCFACRIRKT